jgi:GTP-binding protein
MKDLVEDGEAFVAAKGGKGGKGNVHFKNSVRQAPNFAEAGGFARERNVILEMKVIADVGLVGFPNVGKSSLLATATSAQPKIENYHFTTIAPNLGVVQVYDTSFAMADIAGIIEGAHKGLGLGLKFLKHIERTKVLIHVVDVSGSEGRDPIEDFDKINNELRMYSESVANKPMLVAANKMDMIEETDPQYIAFRDYVEGKGYRVFPICAPINQGVPELMAAAAEELQKAELNPPEEEPYVFFDMEADDVDPTYREIYASKEGDTYVLSGKQLQKIFDSTNFNDMGSLRYLYRYIEKQGGLEKLEKLGLEEGDTIRIFDYEFEYWDEY